MKCNGTDLQRQVLVQILKVNHCTEVAKRFRLTREETAASFKSKVPLMSYEDIVTDIQCMMAGNTNILCSGGVTMYAKSSGTTNARSKYIPMSGNMHRYNHVASSWDTMAIVYKEDEDAEIFRHKSTIMGGAIEHIGVARVGDVSALLLDKMHWAGRPFFTPDFTTATMPDWPKKIEKMASICSEEPVVMIGGVPSWTMILCNRILEQTGKKHMLEVWPTVKYYMHGGVGFSPYRDQFRDLFPSEDFKYYEVYNASEGYFAVQDESNGEGMLLLLDNGIYFEFVPLNDIGTDRPLALNLEEVELGKDYAIVITTIGGLWRYVVGDTVRFTSLKPYRIMVSGRTKQYINVFGEEVMVANTDNALAKTCSQLDVSVAEYTVAPKHMTVNESGYHHWYIEFKHDPESIKVFAEMLDLSLRRENSDYDAKRKNNMILTPLKITAVPKGLFYKWMKSRDKYGGQHKVPRLANDDRYVKELESMIKEYYV